MTISGTSYNVFVNHPAGSDKSKLDHTQKMLNLAKGLDHVILLGDFNWRPSSQFYSMVTAEYTDCWISVYPTGIDNNGLNMTRAIDHIFVSKGTNILDATYIPSPMSETDHPTFYVQLGS